MARDTLYVSPHQDQWAIRTDEEQGDSDFPFYDSKEQAIDAAIASAQNSAKRGRSGDVYVADADSGFRLERSFEPSQG